MPFEYLDDECEKILTELLKMDSVLNINRFGSAIGNLIDSGYIKGFCSTTFSDTEDCYVLSTITQKGRTYFELKEKYIKDQKKLNSREWKIAIVSVLLGAIIGLLPWVLSLFKF